MAKDTWPSHLAVMGQKVSFLSKNWVLRTEYGLSCPSITLQAEGVGLPQKKKGADEGPHKANTCSWITSVDTSGAQQTS